MVLSEAASFLRIAAADLDTSATRPIRSRLGSTDQPGTKRSLSCWLTWRLNFSLMSQRIRTSPVDHPAASSDGVTSAVAWSYGAGFRGWGSPPDLPKASGSGGFHEAS